MLLHRPAVLFKIWGNPDLLQFCETYGKKEESGECRAGPGRCVEKGRDGHFPNTVWTLRTARNRSVPYPENLYMKSSAGAFLLEIPHGTGCYSPLFPQISSLSLVRNKLVPVLWKYMASNLPKG